MNSSRRIAGSAEGAPPQDIPRKLGPALPPTWQQYRHGFVVLQHVAALEPESPGGSVSIYVLSSHLGFSCAEVEDVAGFLVEQGYLAYGALRSELRLTHGGSEYLRGYAGRRQSTRPATTAAPPLDEASPRDPPLPRQRVIAKRRARNQVSPLAMVAMGAAALITGLLSGVIGMRWGWGIGS